MRLSADRINKKSPYWVIQLDELTFRFVTRNGILYRVGFYQDQYFLGSRAFHFFIANDSEARAPKDNDVFRVITCVLEEFFRQDPRGVAGGRQRPNAEDDARAHRFDIPAAAGMFASA